MVNSGQPQSRACRISSPIFSRRERSSRIRKCCVCPVYLSEAWILPVCVVTIISPPGLRFSYIQRRMSAYSVVCSSTSQQVMASKGCWSFGYRAWMRWGLLRFSWALSIAFLEISHPPICSCVRPNLFWMDLRSDPSPHPKSNALNTGACIYFLSARRMNRLRCRTVG